MADDRATVTVITFPDVVSSPVSSSVPAKQHNQRRGPSDDCNNVSTSRSLPMVTFHQHRQNVSSSFIPATQLSSCSSFCANSAAGPQQQRSSSDPSQKEDPVASTSPLPAGNPVQTGSKPVNRSVPVVVRLVSTESSNPRTETVLQIRNVFDDKDQTRTGDLKDIVAEHSGAKTSPKSCFQWFLISFAWIVAMNGLILFLTFLILSLTGYSCFFIPRFSSTFITVNGIISLLAAAYFCVKMRKYFS